MFIQPHLITSIFEQSVCVNVLQLRDRLNHLEVFLHFINIFLFEFGWLNQMENN